MQLLFEIAKQERCILESYQPLSGGDINEVYLLLTSNEKWVIKLNNKDRFPRMFKQEAFALETLANTNTFKIPKVICTGEYQNHAYLIMEFVEAGLENNLFWENFGIKLANLHKNTSKNFGWKHQNYIGSLAQYNEYCSSSSAFYISQRLEPQFKLAKHNGFDFHNLNLLYQNITQLIPEDENPALIHGDLWSGNYMVDAKQTPVLIDPAIAYASREMDVAMMQLFGGFPPEVFEAYNAHFPLLADWKSRIELYQLYYLLVHLNLFGKTYLKSVKRIIEKYS